MKKTHAFFTSLLVCHIYIYSFESKWATFLCWISADFVQKIVDGASRSCESTRKNVHRIRPRMMSSSSHLILGIKPSSAISLALKNNYYAIIKLKPQILDHQKLRAITSGPASMIRMKYTRKTEREKKSEEKSHCFSCVRLCHESFPRIMWIRTASAN